MRLLYAHRGAPAEQPENTLPSFKLALELGANALETDAHLTSDGQVVLSHDPTGARLTGQPKPIAECTLAEVKSWDAGWGFVDAEGNRPFAGRGYTVPTFEELLVEVPQAIINVDAKPESPQMIPALLEVVRRHGAQGRVRIASFSHLNLLRARKAGYEGSTGLSGVEVMLLLSLPIPALSTMGLEGRAAQVPRRSGAIRLDTHRFIERCHAIGVRVDYWTVDDPGEAQALFELGADGVMTNNPRVVAPAVRSLLG
jgi:glycerophosphoryl diester phosphodiesterase